MVSTARHHRKIYTKNKHYRRIFSRFEKTARNYKDLLHLAAALVWLR